MEHICANCLNAYNSPHDKDVHCCNREWLAENIPGYRTTVAADESCGTWQQRNKNQKTLVFPKSVQLTIFDNALTTSL